MKIIEIKLEPGLATAIPLRFIFTCRLVVSACFFSFFSFYFSIIRPYLWSVISPASLCYCHHLGSNCDHQSPRSSTVAKLAKVDSLPGAQIQMAIGNGNAYRTSDERSLQVSRHVIGPFNNV
jgi:hypothetical protein